MNKEIKKSVHDIVDFVYASGDLLPTFFERNQLQDGIKIHQMIASSYPDAEKEVYVKEEATISGYHCTISGRIDLLEKIGDTYHIIEVKSTSQLEEDKESMNLQHFAQAKFYGYMLYKQFEIDHLKTIDISVLYVNKYTYQKRFFTKTYSYFELEKFFRETLDQYLAFMEIIHQFKEQKLTSIQEMKFPYANFRQGQGYLMKQVYEHQENSQDFFIHAPTGIGKSLGTLYPSLKASHDGEHQIFYLTAKTVVKDVARQAMNTLRSHSGLRSKSLSITAKEKICINEEFKCNPKDCPYAKDFYRKLNGAVKDIYLEEDDFSYDTITSYAYKHELCPFEFQLALSLYSDVVICDYNYVYDPRVYLRRFFDIEQPKMTLLIDEAHNMYDRVTNMYTTSINIAFIERIKHAVKNEKPVIKSCDTIIQKLEQYERTLSRQNLTNMKYDDCDASLLSEVVLLLTKLEKYFEKLKDQDEEIEEALLFDYYDLSHFNKIADFFNEDFIIWVEKTKDDIHYQISCLNPKELIKMRSKLVRSSIFFSATLHPMDYFIYLLGGDESSSRLTIDSPFKREHLELFVNTKLSTKYTDREQTKEQIANSIFEVVQNNGKYLIFFPSYQYLEMVYDLFHDLVNENIILIRQERQMSEFKKRAFMAHFDTSKQHVVGFAVLGGSFSEGIDLQGERLNGVVVVGVGLPTFDDYRKELRHYFDKQGLNGYRYAFTYPGFNKILQAVGRVIRGETDQGIALLIDSRYKTSEYLSLFPRHWSHYKRI